MKHQIPQKNTLAQVLQTIEYNLDDELNTKQLSSISGYSHFHFLRLFKAYTGEGIYAYRKRLLLERSVKHLLHSKMTITDIAFACGYNNQTSFNKAFKHHFLYSPSQIRKTPQLIKKYTHVADISPISPLTFSYVYINEKTLISARGTGYYSLAAQQAWETLNAFINKQNLANERYQMFGIFSDDPNIVANDNIRYDAAIELTQPPPKHIEGITPIKLQQGKYAKFHHVKSMQSIRYSYQYIFNQWLPSSGKTLRYIPIFEKYVNHRDSFEASPQTTVEIYIPID